MKKKHVFVLAVMVVCLSICVGGTLAYFTASETARNVITAGNIRIELIETDAEGNPFQNVSGVVPGDSIDKIVTFKNTSDNPCWVRVCVENEIQLMYSQEKPDLSLLEIDFNTERWTEKDGFYYYNAELAPGETTAPLFTKVSFDDSMDNIYQNCTVMVTVFGQAVQTANNGNSVLEASGWPEN